MHSGRNGSSSSGISNTSSSSRHSRANRLPNIAVAGPNQVHGRAELAHHWLWRMACVSLLPLLPIS
jgi:hypothetical protein